MGGTGAYTCVAVAAPHTPCVAALLLWCCACATCTQPTHKIHGTAAKQHRTGAQEHSSRATHSAKQTQRTIAQHTQHTHHSSQSSQHKAGRGGGIHFKTCGSWPGGAVRRNRLATSNLSASLMPITLLCFFVFFFGSKQSNPTLLVPSLSKFRGIQFIYCTYR